MRKMSGFSSDISGNCSALPHRAVYCFAAIMSSPYQPPDVAQHVPPTMLAYASARGTQPIPLLPEYAHLLNQADEFRSGARSLRISGFSDLFWGVPLTLGGLLLTVISLSRVGPTPLPIWIGASALTIGVILLATGTWLVFFPTPGAMIVDGISMVTLAALNGAWYMIDRLHGKQPSWIWIGVFVICLFSGISRFRRYGKFAQAS